jgi:uncharacterized membrane protein YphA (DoxX/SURF4 family)
LTGLTAPLRARTHILPFIARLAVGALFLVAGILKLGHAADLAATIGAFKLGLPAALVGTIAVGLPPFEILLGIYLLGGFLPQAAAYTATLLLAAFIVVLSSVVMRGLSAPCGCFGPADNEPATWWTVLRDGAAIVPAAYLAWWSTAAQLRQRRSGTPRR